MAGGHGPARPGPGAGPSAGGRRRFRPDPAAGRTALHHVHRCGLLQRPDPDPRQGDRGQRPARPGRVAHHGRPRGRRAGTRPLRHRGDQLGGPVLPQRRLPDRRRAPDHEDARSRRTDPAGRHPQSAAAAGLRHRHRPARRRGGRRVPGHGAGHGHPPAGAGERVAARSGLLHPARRAGPGRRRRRRTAQTGLLPQRVDGLPLRRGPAQAGSGPRVARRRARPGVEPRRGHRHPPEHGQAARAARHRRSQRPGDGSGGDRPARGLRDRHARTGPARGHRPTARDRPRDPVRARRRARLHRAPDVDRHRGRRPVRRGVPRRRAGRGAGADRCVPDRGRGRASAVAAGQRPAGLRPRPSPRHRTAPPRGTPAAGPHGARRRRRPGRVAVDAQRQAGHTAVARTRVRLPGGTAAGHPAGSGDGGALRRRARPGLGRRRRPLLRPRRRQHPLHPTRRQGTRGGVPDHPARRVPRPDGRGPGGPGRPERRGVPGGRRRGRGRRRLGGDPADPGPGLPGDRRLTGHGPGAHHPARHRRGRRTAADRPAAPLPLRPRTHRGGRTRPRARRVAPRAPAGGRSPAATRPGHRDPADRAPGTSQPGRPRPGQGAGRAAGAVAGAEAGQGAGARRTGRRPGLRRAARRPRDRTAAGRVRDFPSALASAARRSSPCRRRRALRGRRHGTHARHRCPAGRRRHGPGGRLLLGRHTVLRSRRGGARRPVGDLPGRAGRARRASGTRWADPLGRRSGQGQAVDHQPVGDRLPGPPRHPAAHSRSSRASCCTPPPTTTAPTPTRARPCSNWTGRWTRSGCDRRRTHS